MNPKIAPAWNIVRQALAAVKADLAEHQAIQQAAAQIEAHLTPKEKTPAPVPVRPPTRKTPPL